MLKFLLALLLFSSQLLAMLEETEQEKELLSPHEQPVTIIRAPIYCDHRWHEVEAELSNGDTVTFTKFVSGNLKDATHCVYAKKVSASFEIREKAPTDWHHKMESYYNQTMQKHKSPISSIY